MIYTGKARVMLNASPETVFAALTQEAQVSKWLAPDARVDVAAGIFQLWGRALPGNPSESATEFEGFEPNRSLNFSWRLFGEDGSVRLAISRKGSGTVLAVEHEYDVPTSPDGKKVLHAGVADFWGLAFENLRRLLSGDGNPLFKDYSQASAGHVELDIRSTASPEQVFQALTDPKQLNRWIAKDATVEPHVDGRYDYGWGYCPIKILEIKPNQLLSYSWQYGDDPETVVTWTLEGSEGGTRITLVHSGFARTRGTDDYGAGWLKFLAALRNYLEMGEGWQRVALADEEFDFVEE